MRRSVLVIVALVAIGAILLAGCGPASGTQGASKTAGSAMAPVSALPREMQDAPQRVRSAYQFALTNPDALKNVPCYCGCGAMGHTSNLSCYVKERKADGTVVFEDHALGCSLCVDISQDVMRMTNEGKTPQAIRADIVAAYSKFGPANQ